MDIDTLLSDTFAAHEYLAPNEDEISSVVHQQISQRRPSLTRALAVAATVAVVAGGALVIAGHRHSVAAPRVQSAAGASSAQSESAPHSATGRLGATIAPLTMPFNLGWLPAGAIAFDGHQIKIGGDQATGPFFDGEYSLTVTTSAAQKFYIDVQQMPYGLGDARIKYAPATSITVNGRDGIEGVGPGGYEVYFVDSAGGLVYVNVGPEAGSKVAAGFGLGYVPAGLKLTTFSVQTASLVLPMTPGSGPRTSTSYGLGSARPPRSSPRSRSPTPFGPARRAACPGGRSRGMRRATPSTRASPTSPCSTRSTAMPSRSRPAVRSARSTRWPTGWSCPSSPRPRARSSSGHHELTAAGAGVLELGPDLGQPTHRLDQSWGRQGVGQSQEAFQRAIHTEP